MREAIRALEKISIDMPQVCIMNTSITHAIPAEIARDIGLEVENNYSVSGDPYNMTINYFKASGILVGSERCRNLISNSREALGEFDFFFEWFKTPTREQLFDLIRRIDEALTSLHCMYTITNK
jgi:hypothetical protein